MAKPGYILEFRQSQFMRTLLAPMSKTDAAAAIAEDRKERANCWHETWILANAAIAARDSDHWERIHNTFYGDNSRRDSEELRALAHDAVQKLVLTPALIRQHLATKRALARRIVFDQSKWPDDWKRAVAEDEAALNAKRLRREASHG